VNLYTHIVKTMASDLAFESRFERIYQALTAVYDTLDDLMEDPLFIDGIHGEEELGLDQAMELLDSIMRHFEPATPAVKVDPAFERESYDAD
jgi:hypothetical protein